METPHGRALAFALLAALTVAAAAPAAAPGPAGPDDAAPGTGPEPGPFAAPPPGGAFWPGPPPAAADDDPPPPPLADLVRAADARLGVDRPDGAVDAALARLPADLERPLARLLAAVLDAQAARDRAAADLDDGALLAHLAGAAPAPSAEGVDGDAMRAAAEALRRAALREVPALERARAGGPGGPAGPGAAVPLAGPPAVDLAPVLVVDPFGADNLYDRDAVLAVDLGGDDLWDSNAGGSIVALFPSGDPSTYQHQVGPVAVGGDFEDAFLVVTASLAVDVAGNDTYGLPRAPGALDGRCTDEPVVRRVVVQGAGSGGVGVLVDAAGDDIYRAKTLAQGAGHVGGAGVLDDLDGDDTYRAVRAAQGAGILGGSGLLHDRQGDDRYLFEAPAGGILNVDSQRCDATVRFGLGAGVLGATGHLVDGDGADLYRIGDQALGFGALAATGTFADAGGDPDDYGGYPGRGDDRTTTEDGGLFWDG